MPRVSKKSTEEQIETVKEAAIDTKPKSATAKPKKAASAKAPEPVKLPFDTMDLIKDDSYGDLLKTVLPQDEERDAMNRMRMHIRQRHICKGYIYAVESKNGMVYVVIRDSDKLRVLIPDDQFFLPGTFSDNDDRMSGDKIKRYQQYASRMIGAIITYIPVDMGTDNEGNCFVVASRLQSAMMKREKYFFGKNGPVVKAGSIVEASILTANDDSIRVELFGVEVRVHRTQLSGREVPKNVADDFKVGSGFVAKVTHLELEPETKSVRLRLSKAELDRDAGDGGNVMEATLGGRYMATVMKVLQNAYILILDGMNLRALVKKEYYMGTSVLMPGDKVVFRCSAIDEENQILRGGCLKA